MRIHVKVALRCKEPKLGNKLRALGKELDSGNTSKVDPQQFPLLNTILNNPPKFGYPVLYNFRCTEFKYSAVYERLTIYLNSEEDTIKATAETLKDIIKELMELTGLTEFLNARIESRTTAEEYKKFKGLDAIPVTTVTIGD